MIWNYRFCCRNYRVDNVVPADRQFQVTHGVCPACYWRMKPPPRPKTEEDWVVTMVSAIVQGRPIPARPFRDVEADT